MADSQQSPVRATHTLTYAGARLALDAALAKAEEIEGRFNIAVTDTGGALLAFARMDGAFALSAEIAIDKARTVAGFGGIPSADLYAGIESEEAVRFGIAGRPGGRRLRGVACRSLSAVSSSEPSVPQAARRSRTPRSRQPVRARWARAESPQFGGGA